MSIETMFILNKLLMTATGYKPPVLHHVAGGCIVIGGIAVGVHDGGAALHLVTEGFLNLLFQLSVKHGGGLV